MAFPIKVAPQQSGASPYSVLLMESLAGNGNFFFFCIRGCAQEGFNLCLCLFLLCMPHSVGTSTYASIPLSVPLHMHTLLLHPLLQYSCVPLVRDNSLRGNTADVAPQAYKAPIPETT